MAELRKYDIEEIMDAAQIVREQGGEAYGTAVQLLMDILVSKDFFNPTEERGDFYECMAEVVRKRKMKDPMTVPDVLFAESPSQGLH